MSLLRARVPKPIGFRGVGKVWPLPVYVGGQKTPEVGAGLDESEADTIEILIDLTVAARGLTRGDGEPRYLSLWTKDGFGVGVDLSGEETPGSGLAALDVKRR